MYSGNDSVYTYTFEHQRKDDCPVCSTSATKLDFKGDKTLEELMDYLKEKPDVYVTRLDISPIMYIARGIEFEINFFFFLLLFLHLTVN
jgi:hypothetical protein